MTTTMADKQEFQRLNATLEQYLQRVREASMGASPAVLKQLLADLEDQCNRQKNFCEREIAKLNRRLEDAERAKNAAESEAEAQKRCAANYQSRCQDEQRKNEKLLADIECLNQKIREMEKEVSDARAAARGPQEKLDQLQGDVGKAMMKYDAAQNELNKEKAKNKDLQSQLNNALQKQDYNKRSKDEQQRENNARLENAKKLIANLEEKNRALENKNQQLPALMQELRRKNAEEMAAYKEQSDYNNDKNMKELKRQFDALSSQIDKMRDENNQLRSDNDDAKKWMKAMEIRAAELQAQKEALEKQLKAERDEKTQAMRDAEKRLKELNDLVMEKMRENKDTQDVQQELKKEIKHYRDILEGEGVQQVARVSSPYGANGMGRSGGRYSATGGRHGMGSASSNGSRAGRQGLGSSYDAGNRSGTLKLPLRSMKTEYMDRYTPKNTARTSNWDSRRRVELPRVA